MASLKKKKKCLIAKDINGILQDPAYKGALDDHSIYLPIAEDINDT